MKAEDAISTLQRLRRAVVEKGRKKEQLVIEESLASDYFMHLLMCWGSVTGLVETNQISFII